MIIKKGAVRGPAPISKFLRAPAGDWFLREIAFLFVYFVLFVVFSL
jgi:hypothetical protein